MFWRKTKKSATDFSYLHHRSLRCISKKDMKTYRETILGRDGVINIEDDELIVVCQNAEVLRLPLAYLEIAEFMSHDGFTIRDLHNVQADIINVYYTK